MHKDCITLLHHIFEEELELLDNQIVDTEKHIRYLKGYANALQTYYHFKLVPSDQDFYTIANHKEIPFLKDNFFSSAELVDTFSPSYLTNDDIELLIMNYFGNENMYDNLQHSESTHEGKFISLKLYFRIPFSELSPTEICYYYYHKCMNWVYTEFTKNLLDQYYSNELPELEISMLIRKYQKRIELYMGTLYKRLHTIEDSNFDIRYIAINKTFVDIFKKIHHGLRKLLKYMERECSEYFNFNSNMPFYIRKDFFTKYTKDAASLNQMIQKQNLPLAMKGELSRPLLQIMECADLISYTYNHRKYIRKYIHFLSRLFLENPNPNPDQIYGVLIGLDFNTHQVGKLLTDEFLKRLGSYSDQYDKQLYLYEEMTRIKHIQVTSTIRYHFQFPSLKEYLLSYMNQCLDYNTQSLDIKEQYIKVTTPSLDAIPIDKEKASKRKLNLSIGEFSLFSRLVIDSGIIPLKSGEKEHFFKFLSGTFASKDKYDISEGSIKNAFYSISNQTYINVEKKLLLMLKKLRVIKNENSINDT